MSACETISIESPECVICDDGPPFAIWQSRRRDSATDEYDQIIKYPVCSACYERIRSMDSMCGTSAYDSFWQTIVSKVKFALYRMQRAAQCNLN